jgi:hypothetical protein
MTMNRLNNSSRFVTRLGQQEALPDEDINFRFAYLHCEASQPIAPSLPRSAHPHSRGRDSRAFGILHQVTLALRVSAGHFLCLSMMIIGDRRLAVPISI